jgi:sphingomyelin phosphodiesterase
MLNFIYKNSNSTIIPEIIIWTGDNPTHNLLNLSNQGGVLNITKILTDQINDITKSLNYTIQIYPSLGNHEKFPNDILNPFDEYSLKQVYRAYGDIWRNWLGEEAYKTFIQFGYYSKLHPNSNLRIISYNCLYCDSLNFYLIKNPTDPQLQIKWIEGELRKAENNNEFVYLISHIPIMDDFFLIQCSKRLRALMDRFSHIIRGHFTGHTHEDHVNLQEEYFPDEKGNRNITGAIFTAPSLTT